MTAEAFDIDLVSLESLKSYLDENPWRRSSHEGGFDLFTFGSKNQIEIVLPINEQGRDLKLMMGQAIRTLSALKNKNLGKITEEIQGMAP